ncbi:carboxymuconolactone decarboxylase family protein [Actinomadura hibisca]|uniref:carboxymuconolactone decarboxylase family protein n=1 Tax=Actinomadura hibisca TaxID=68565 RepID=UPI00082DCBBE|nr:carboxymuconolactone decarboxylase family protein [Actinomadura hibisca]
MTADPSDRYRRGLETMRQVNEADGERMREELAKVAPDLERYLLEFVFGDVYSRPRLPMRERQLVRLAALAALGVEYEPMKANVDSALNTGVEQADIIEVFVQCLPYIGFPRVLAAVQQTKRVLDERSAAQ